MSQAQPSLSPQQAPMIQETIQQVLLKTAGIEERLQCLANGVEHIDHIRIPTTFSSTPLHIHMYKVKLDSKPTLLQVQHILYPLQHQVCIDKTMINGSCASNGAPSIVSGTSLESHMTEIRKTLLKLAQAHEKISNTQQQNHQTMVNVQLQQATAFEALAATTQQQQYDTMFAAVPRYDGKNKEECAVC